MKRCDFLILKAALSPKLPKRVAWALICCSLDLCRSMSSFNKIFTNLRLFGLNLSIWASWSDFGPLNPLSVSEYLSDLSSFDWTFVYGTHGLVYTFEILFRSLLLYLNLVFWDNRCIKVVILDGWLGQIEEKICQVCWKILLSARVSNLALCSQ